MIIAGNWKMNQTKAAAVSFCAMLNQSSGRIASGRQMLLFPAFVHLDCVLANLADSPVEVGGQTCHPEHKGAHTGDISAPMLADLGCDWVLLGHSERRADHFEDDRLIAASLAAARAAGLKIMLCVGETRAHKEAGEAKSVVAGQLAGALGPASAGRQANWPSPMSRSGPSAPGWLPASMI